MRSHFNRSALVRQLAGWQSAPVEPPRQDLAEQLGQWLGVADAIALSAALQAVPAPARGRRPAGLSSAAALQAEFDRVRSTLAQAITRERREAGDESHDNPPDDFAIHHQHGLEQQRRMELVVSALREHVRKTLLASSARMARLAALDAVLDPMLGGREHQLLATVPTLLKARFEALRQTGETDWPARFQREMQNTLLAELELRLQPVAGMIEALGLEAQPHA